MKVELSEEIDLVQVFCTVIDGALDAFTMGRNGGVLVTLNRGKIESKFPNVTDMLDRCLEGHIDGGNLSGPHSSGLRGIDRWHVIEDVLDVMDKLELAYPQFFDMAREDCANRIMARYRAKTGHIGEHQELRGSRFGELLGELRSIQADGELGDGAIDMRHIERLNKLSDEVVGDMAMTPDGKAALMARIVSEYMRILKHPKLVALARSVECVQKVEAYAKEYKGQLDRREGEDIAAMRNEFVRMIHNDRHVELSAIDLRAMPLAVCRMPPLADAPNSWVLRGDSRAEKLESYLSMLAQVIIPVRPQTATMNWGYAYGNANAISHIIIETPNTTEE